MKMDMKNNLQNVTLDIPYLIGFTLYKYNYFDNLLLSNIKKELLINKIEDDILIISSNDLKKLINNKFRTEIDKIKLFSYNSLSDNVNSIYFIDKILSMYNNLKYIKINVSNSRDYSRLIDTGKSKIINFDYKILTSVIDFTKYTRDDKQLKLINNLLYKVNVLKKNSFGDYQKPYIIITASNLINSLNIIEPEIEDSEISDIYIEPLELIYDIIDQKLENDNTNLIIITDYPE